MAKNKIKVGLSDIKSSVKEVTKSVKSLSDLAEDFFNSMSSSMKSLLEKNKDTTDSIEGSYDDMFTSIEKRGQSAVRTLDSYFASLKKHGIDMGNMFNASKAKQQAVNTALYDVATGKMTATTEQVTALSQRKHDIDSALNQGMFVPVAKALRDSVSRSTLGQLGFSNFTSAITSGYDRYASKRDELRQSFNEAQANFEEQRKALIVKRNDTRRLVAQGQMSPNDAEKAQADIAKGLTDIASKSEASKLAMSEASTAELTSFVKGATGDLFIDLAIIAAKALADLFKEAKKMIDDVATYSLSSSYIVNSQARQQALQYGLSDAQNYAFTQTKSLMGISSDEDMYYMNQNQRQMFSTLMSREMEFYNRLNSNGTLEGLQEMQMDFAILKQEFIATVGEFIVDNKETIINFAKMGLEALTFIANVLSGIFKGISYLNPVNWFKGMSGSKSITVNTSNAFYGSDGKSASDISNTITDKERVALSNFFNS